MGELKESIAMLRQQREERPRDPRLLGWLAEALSRTKTGAEGARRLLEKLAAKGLLKEAEGLAALARLRKAKGEVQAAEEAIARCIEITRDPDRCSVEPLPPPRKTPRWRHWDCIG